MSALSWMHSRNCVLKINFLIRHAPAKTQAFCKCAPLNISAHFCQKCRRKLMSDVNVHLCSSASHSDTVLSLLVRLCNCIWITTVSEACVCTEQELPVSECVFSLPPLDAASTWMFLLTPPPCENNWCRMRHCKVFDSPCVCFSWPLMRQGVCVKERVRGCVSARCISSLAALQHMGTPRGLMHVWTKTHKVD